MTQVQIKETERFTLVDENGAEYNAVQFTKFNRSQHIGQDAPSYKGPQYYELDDGTPLDHRRDDTFEIVTTGEVLRRRA